MWVVLDVAVVAIMVYSIVRGCKKGLVKTAFKCGIVIAALILAYSFGPVVSNYVQGTKSYVKITESVRMSITKNLTEHMAQNQDDTQASEKLTTSDANEGLFNANAGLSSALSGLGLDSKSIDKQIDERVKQGLQSIDDAINDIVVKPVSQMLCNALCFVAVLVVALLVLQLVMYLLDAVFRLPLLRSVNKVGGGFAGIIAGLLKIFVFCTLFEMLLPYIQNPSIGLYCGMQSKTILYRVLMEYNPLSFLY